MRTWLNAALAVLMILLLQPPAAVAAASASPAGLWQTFGLVIMRNMRLQNGEYGGGDILDPRSGSVYPCSFHLAGGGSQLVIRGYIGIPLFGRSQTWTRVE